MTTFTKTLNAIAVARLEDGPLHVDEIVAGAIAEHRDLFKAEGEVLAERAARRVVKDVMRKLGEDETQQTLLPGVSLPSVIYVERDGAEPYYRRTDLATWEELQAGLAERDRNVDRARAKLRKYREGLARLAPLMADEPELTAGEALRREHAEQAA